MTLSRRDFLKKAAVAGAGLALAACKPEVVKETVVVTEEKVVKETVEKVVTATPESVELGQVTLQFAQYGPEGFDDPLYGGMLKKQQERLKAMYQTLDFECVQVNYQKQAMAMAAGNAADVSIINVPGAWPLMYRKQLTNLSPIIDADPEWQEFITHFNPTTIAAYTYEGDLYGTPFSLETSGTIYNEDLLVEAGVKLPHEYGETEWDWNAYIETAAPVVKGEGAEKVWGCWMHPDVQSGLGDMVYSHGGRWLTDDGLASRVAEDVFVEAAEVAVGMVTKDGVSPSTGTLSSHQLSAYSAFINGKVAFMVSGDWAFGWILNNQLPENKFKLNFFTSPVSPKTKQPIGVGHSTAFYAWAGSPHLNEAVAMVKFLASKESQILWSENWTNSPILSPRDDCQDAFWDMGLVPNADAMKRAFEVAQPYPHTPLMNASIAIGYVNTGIGLAREGEDTRPIAEICAEIDGKINADLAKGASG